MLTVSKVMAGIAIAFIVLCAIFGIITHKVITGKMSVAYTVYCLLHIAIAVILFSAPWWN